jgi:YidC/Oxa1 family membrane protein insertase
MIEAIISVYRCFFLHLAGAVGLGWGIVLLSVICSALMIPLMRLVTGVVRREADYQSIIMPQLADIKARYASDVERHLHIQRLYRRYGYSPLSAVKKVLPLFVQIPFLLLTYFMLKDTVELRGVTFFFLKDLGRPDALLPMLSVNILPFAMTAVNIVTVFATPGFTPRDRTQAIGISLLFLLLLYTAPSALLLYWTLNNAITMARTLVSRRGEGARLLLSRMSHLREVPAMVRRMATPGLLAYMTLALILLTLYFFVTAKLLIVFNEGPTCKTMFRGMTYLLALASGAQFLHLRRVPHICKPVLYACAFMCIGFAMVLAVLYISSRMLFIRFREWVDMFAAVFCLLVIWTLPYLLVKGALGAGLLRDMRRALARNGWMLGFPAIFGIHYAYASEVFLLPMSSLLILCAYMVVTCVALFVFLLILFRPWIDACRLFSISVGVFVGIYIIPLISTETGILAYDRNLLVRIAVVGAMAFLFACIRKRRKGIVFQAILLVSTVFHAFINHGRDISSPVTRDEGLWRERMEQVVGDAHCVKSNNVYLLAYDAYGHRSILDGLGLQDDGVYEQLRERGYTLYDAYSVGVGTLTSMSEMFTFNGICGDGTQATVCGDNVFCDLLREAGYRTSYILLGYVMPPKGSRKPGDYYFPGESKVVRPEMVLFPCIMRGTLSQSPSVFDSYSMDEWLEEKKAALKRSVGEGTRSFVYAHMEYPAHAPWRPRYRKSDSEEQRMYGERLQKANEQMMKDIELLEQDPNAIVILMSDHGGSLIIPEHTGTWDVKNLVDHFGIFLAIRWPKDYVPTLKLDCLQNVFVEVMIYLTGDRSLQRLENPGITFPLDYPFGTPGGAIRNGVIQFGDCVGGNFFDAARRVFNSDIDTGVTNR